MYEPDEFDKVLDELELDSDEEEYPQLG